MKRKQLLTKTFLIAAMLFMGMSVWAAVGDVTTNADINCTGTISEGVLAGTVNSMTIGTGGAETSIVNSSYMKLGDHSNTVTIPETQRAGTRDIVTVSFDMAWGNKSGMGSGIALKDADGSTIAYFDKARWGSAADNLNITWTNILGGHNSNQAVWNNRTHFVITVNYATELITTVATLGSTTETFTVSMTNTNPIATFAVRGYGAGSNADRASLFGNLIIKTTEGDYTVSSANYTVNWDCAGSTVKTATRTGDVGSTITLLDSDDDSFTVNETRYMYVSDDAEGKTVADDGSTVVTITVREPAVYNYSVKAIDADESVLSTIASGSVTEDANSVTTNIPWYVLKDGTLYYQNTNSNTTTITEDNQVINITYTSDKTNIVYYSEAENIGGNWIGSTNCSNGRASKDLTSVKFATIEAGKYKIYSRFVVGNGSSGSTYSTNPFTIGEKPLVYNVPAKNNTDYTSEEFIVAESTDLYVTFSGSSISGVDYICVQRIGDATIPATISASGYTSLSSAYALDFSGIESLTAYVVKAATSDGVTLSSVNEAPAETGLILKGTVGETYNIPVVASATEPAVNLLSAAVTATVVDDGSVYILKGGKFCLLEGAADVAARTIPAGKAYLPKDKVTPGKVDLAVAFEEEAVTGIESVQEFKGSKVQGYYDLQGRCVSQPTKGLYIIDGKKVVVK